MYIFIYNYTGNFGYGGGQATIVAETREEADAVMSEKHTLSLWTFHSKTAVDGVDAQAPCVLGMSYYAE